MKNVKTVKNWLLTAAACLLAVCLPVCAQAAKAVRIGYVDYSGFFTQHPGGQQSGYVYDLMMECAQLTDRDYTFVQVEPDTCAEQLKNGQVDLLVGVPASLPCAAGLAYGTQSVLNTPKTVVVLPDSALGYGDTAQLAGKTIAVCHENTAVQLESMLAGEGITAAVVVLESREQMLAALAAGEADAAVLDSDMGITGLRAVTAFARQDVYCAALAGGDTALLQETERALRGLMSSSPALLDTLHTRYLVVDDDVRPSLTADEIKYIRKGRKIVVAVPKEDMLRSGQPVPWVEKVLAELTAKTGLQFTCQVWDTEARALHALRGGKADILLGFDSDNSWSQHSQVRRTVPYLEESYRMVRLPETAQVKKVAVVDGSYIAYRISRDGGYQLLACPDGQSCVQAVLEGQADGALLLSGDAQQILYDMSDSVFASDNLDAYPTSLSIAVSRQASFRLTPLLNKAIASIRPQRFRAIAVPAAGEATMLRQQTDARQKNLAVGLSFLAALALLAGAALWMVDRMKTAQLQVNARNDYLRTMTSRIRRPAQTLQGVAAGGSRLDRADVQQALGTAGEQLGELANETEMMSQLDDHTFALNPVPVRLADVMERLSETVTQRAGIRGVQLEVRRPDTDPPTVMLDETSYRHVCLILIENAISRTEGGGRMELSFALERVREKKNQWVLVTGVGDDGAVMSRQFIRRIAERTRRDSERVLGLRLMTGKKIAQAMGGELGVRQRPNGGMRMVLRLPVERAELLQTMSMNRGVYGKEGLLSGVNILVAEGNPVTAQLLYSVLSNEGAHVDLVQNGQQLLDRFLASPPAFYQAILTDLTLPELSGTEAAAAIRDLPRRDCSSVFILGMQAGATPADPEEAHAMNMILQKPLNLGILCRKLRTWLFAGGRE